MKKTNVPGSQSFGQKLLQFIRNNTVPIMFILICAYCIPQAGFSWSYLLNEVMTRLGRNAFLILSLLIPVMAGMGMNFGMTLGAMAGEIGLIFAADWQVWGIPGMILAAIVSIPISVALGVMIGKILNRSKGREMITSYMISFTMNGVYQFVVLFMMGPIIPIVHDSLKLPRGYGIRNTVSLLSMRQSLDNLLAVQVGGVKIPVLTLLIIGLACLFIVCMVISTVFAGFGMIIYLQNVGNFPTYTAHTQIGMFAIAALLVGGASVDRASIGNVFLGVILFHTMFIVAPKTGAAITGDSMIGEYFRVFVSYAVITLALVMYESKKRKNKSLAGQQLAAEQAAEEEASK